MGIDHSDDKCHTDHLEEPMDDQPSDRYARMAALIDDRSIEELRQTALQAIDHAYKSAAEVAEAWARYEGAMGTIAELHDSNRRLRERIDELENDLKSLRSLAAWRGAQVVAGPSPTSASRETDVTKSGVQHRHPGLQPT